MAGCRGRQLVQVQVARFRLCTSQRLLTQFSAPREVSLLASDPWRLLRPSLTKFFSVALSLALLSRGPGLSRPTVALPLLAGLLLLAVSPFAGALTRPLLLMRSLLSLLAGTVGRPLFRPLLPLGGVPTPPPDSSSAGCSGCRRTASLPTSRNQAPNDGGSLARG